VGETRETRELGKRGEHEKSGQQKTPSVAASGLGVRQSMMKDDLTPARRMAG
jgi:hypothetical protein